MRTAPDRRSRATWLLFLAGPTIWFAHFMAVYLLAEATCATGGFSFRVGGVPLLSFAVLVATAVACAVTALLARRAYRRWRTTDAGSAEWLAGEEHEGGLLLGGALLGVLFATAILIVGLPALWLEPC